MTKPLPSMFQVEQDVPMPPRSRYPFAELAVGESFFVEDMTKWNSLRTAATNSRYGTFSVRKTNRGIRVWRVS